MVDGQLAERQMFHYPPYYRLVYVYLKNHNEALLDQMAAVMADKLRTVFGNRVLGPDKPPVARIQTLFIKKIVLKIEQNARWDVRGNCYNVSRKRCWKMSAINP